MSSGSATRQSKKRRVAPVNVGSLDSIQKKQKNETLEELIAKEEELRQKYTTASDNYQKTASLANQLQLENALSDLRKVNRKIEKLKFDQLIGTNPIPEIGFKREVIESTMESLYSQVEQGVLSGAQMTLDSLRRNALQLVPDDPNNPEEVRELQTFKESLPDKFDEFQQLIRAKELEIAEGVVADVDEKEDDQREFETFVQKLQQVQARIKTADTEQKILSVYTLVEDIQEAINMYQAEWEENINFADALTTFDKIIKSEDFNNLKRKFDEISAGEIVQDDIVPSLIEYLTKREKLSQEDMTRLQNEAERAEKSEGAVVQSSDEYLLSQLQAIEKDYLQEKLNTRDKSLKQLQILETHFIESRVQRWFNGNEVRQIQARVKKSQDDLYEWRQVEDDIFDNDADELYRIVTELLTLQKNVSEADIITTAKILATQNRVANEQAGTRPVVFYDAGRSKKINPQWQEQEWIQIALEIVTELLEIKNNKFIWTTAKEKVKEATGNQNKNLIIEAINFYKNQKVVPMTGDCLDYINEIADRVDISPSGHCAVCAFLEGMRKTLPKSKLWGKLNEIKKMTASQSYTQRINPQNAYTFMIEFAKTLSPEQTVDLTDNYMKKLENLRAGNTRAENWIGEVEVVELLLKPLLKDTTDSVRILTLYMKSMPDGTNNCDVSVSDIGACFKTSTCKQFIVVYENENHFTLYTLKKANSHLNLWYVQAEITKNKAEASDPMVLDDDPELAPKRAVMPEHEAIDTSSDSEVQIRPPRRTGPSVQISDPEAIDSSSDSEVQISDHSVDSGSEVRMIIELRNRVSRSYLFEIPQSSFLINTCLQYVEEEEANQWYVSMKYQSEPELKDYMMDTDTFLVLCKDKKNNASRMIDMSTAGNLIYAKDPLPPVELKQLDKPQYVSDKNFMRYTFLNTLAAILK